MIDGIHPKTHFHFPPLLRRKPMGFADIHEDIIQTQILTRLDGQTLAAAGSAFSDHHSLFSGDTLWSDICSSTWPSTQHPIVQQAILSFSSAHRSFFSDALPPPHHRLTTAAPPPPTTPTIISSVDLRFHDHLVLSKVQSTDTTASEWFESTPFRVDLLEPKEVVQSEVKVCGGDDEVQLDLEKYMTLSWIMIDPSSNRAVNLSSVRPVSVQRNWFMDEMEVSFAVVIAVDSRVHHYYYYVKCEIEVACGVRGGGSELYVSGVSLTVHDIDGKCLDGKDSMVILQGLAVAERPRCGGGGEGWKERYDEYVQRRNERKEMMERRERRLDLVRVASSLGLLIAFWSIALYY